MSHEDLQELEDDTPTPKKVLKPKKLALDILLGPEENNEGTLSIADEIEMYLQSKPPHHSVKWWKMNESRYPNVARLAKSMLCIPVTSTAATRVFSSAGITVSKKRSCLKPKYIDKLPQL